MRRVRQIHLYLSVFFAPLLIFYIGTGWYQTVATQRNKILGEQDTLVNKLTSIHVDQIYPSERVTGEYSTALFKALVVLMSISLLVTIGLGIFLAFRSVRRGWVVAAALGLGTLVPAVFLWLGQGR